MNKLLYEPSFQRDNFFIKKEQLFIFNDHPNVQEFHISKWSNKLIEILIYD